MYIFHKVLTEKDVYNTEMEGTLPIFEECVVHLRRENYKTARYQQILYNKRNKPNGAKVTD